MSSLVLGQSISARRLQYIGVQCSALITSKRPNRAWSGLRFVSTVASTVERSTKGQPRFPLSALPTSMLLRSLLLATISSNRFLLLPSLSVLSFLSKSRRGFLFDVERNPILHTILKKTFYDQFCAGETRAKTKACVRQLKDLGFRGVILTYARETVFDHRTNAQHGLDATTFENQDTLSDPKVIHCTHTENWRKGTLETLDLVEAGDYLALKYVYLST